LHSDHGESITTQIGSIQQANKTGGDNQVTANVPDRFTQFILEPDEKKIEWKLDTRKTSSSSTLIKHMLTTFEGVANTAIFTFNKEDHTLGNLITQRLHKYKYIEFSAYRVPHPLFAKFELRVTTDGSCTPKEAILKACQDIIADLSTLGREFTKEWELKKIAGEHGAGADGY
jgi:DNA-directed RNA polymerase II subunit RPB11